MNFKIFSFISTILLVTREIDSSKKYQTPDTSPISTRFADLLSSLVKVNVERVDALKNLFKLYDVNEAKPILRTTPNDEDKLEENTIKAGMVNWKNVRNKIITADSRNSYDDIHIPKGFNIFFLENSFKNSKYPNYQLRKQIGKYYVLEPIRSSRISPELFDLRSRSRVLKDRIRKKSKDILGYAVERLNLAKPQADVLRRKWFSSCDKKAIKLCKKACKMSHKNVCKVFRCNKDMKRRFKWECARNCKNKFKE